VSEELDDFFADLQSNEPAESDAFVAAGAGELIHDNVDGAIVQHIIKRGVAAFDGAPLAESLRKTTDLYRKSSTAGRPPRWADPTPRSSRPWSMTERN